jgi:hypothetical protein
MRQLIRARASRPAFHPQGAQQILPLNPALFSYLRTAPDDSGRVLCLHNVSNQPQPLDISLAPTNIQAGATLTDLLSGTQHQVAEDHRLSLTVPTYGVLWLSDTDPNVGIS